jgi:hypothetical protein
MKRIFLFLLLFLVACGVPKEHYGSQYEELCSQLRGKTDIQQEQITKEMVGKVQRWTFVVEDVDFYREEYRVFGPEYQITIRNVPKEIALLKNKGETFETNGVLEEAAILDSGRCYFKVRYQE